MTTYCVNAADMARRMVVDLRATKKDLERAMFVAAVRGIRSVTQTINNTKPFPPVDRGMYRMSWQAEQIQGGGVLFSDAPYACLIGSHQQVMTPAGHIRIGDIQKCGQPVLTKDGTYKSGVPFVTGNFRARPLGIRLKCKKGVGSLLVTSDHLILCSREGIPVWERADSLRVGDIVWHKRRPAYNKGTGKIEVVKCPGCGENFSRRVKKTPLLHCSQSCYHKHTDHGRARGKNLGENNPSWRGGASKLPYGPDWNRILKERVRARDSFLCTECGRPEGKTSHNVHHINGNKFDNRMENLVALCVYCHGWVTWRDCELVDVNTDIFEPVPVILSERVSASDSSAAFNTKLWDISVEGENSYYVGGMLVHNSVIEHGARPHFPPIAPLIEWCKRKMTPKLTKQFKAAGGQKVLGKSKGDYIDAQAKSMAYAVAKAIARRGLPPKKILQNTIPELERIALEEMERVCRGA